MLGNCCKSDAKSHSSLKLRTNFRNRESTCTKVVGEGRSKKGELTLSSVTSEAVPPPQDSCWCCLPLVPPPSCFELSSSEAVLGPAAALEPCIAQRSAAFRNPRSAFAFQWGCLCVSSAAKPHLSQQNRAQVFQLHSCHRCATFLHTWVYWVLLLSLIALRLL